MLWKITGWGGFLVPRKGLHEPSRTLLINHNIFKPRDCLLHSLVSARRGRPARPGIHNATCCDHNAETLGIHAVSNDQALGLRPLRKSPQAKLTHPNILLQTTC